MRKTFWRSAVSSIAGIPVALAVLWASAAHCAEPQKAVTAAPSRAAAKPAQSESTIPPEEAKARELRAASIAVQQRLRAQQRAREQAQREQTRNERCVGGQRMRRVANGWVGVGDC